MTLRSRGGLIALLLVLSTHPAWAGHTLPGTHGMVLDSVAALVAGDLLQGALLPQGRPVLLQSPVPGDTLGLLTQRLMERLRAQGVTVRIALPGEVTNDSAAAVDSSSGRLTGGSVLRLNLQVDGSGVTYVRRVGAFPLGTKGYERLAAMRANATLVDPGNGEVFWTKSSSRGATDLVRKGDVVYAASGSGRLNPPVPRGGTRWLEPMIVVGVVAGLVVLFYSNRN